MNLLDRSLPVSARQFGIFRIVLGAYLAVHFAQLLPYANELFGATGILENPDHNLIPKLLPNPMWDGAAWVAPLCIGIGVLSGIGIAIGQARALWCVLAWLVWGWLFARNNLIANPGLPYVGLLILLTAIIPRGEAFVPGRRPSDQWRFPALAWHAVWILLAAGYTFSGVLKLGSPSWIDGSALRDVMSNPLARPGTCDLFLALPEVVTNLMTWGVLGLEIAFLPLAIFRRTRFLAWLGMTMAHLGIIVLIDFADLSLGMLLAHLFAWDPRWGNFGAARRNMIEENPPRSVGTTFPARRDGAGRGRRLSSAGAQARPFPRRWVARDN